MSADRLVEVAPGRRLFVREYGSGAPVLLLHGFTGCGESMERAAAACPPDTRRIFVDLLGHGRSDAPQDADVWSMERCASDLVAVLDALEVPAATVLGYSMGARIALGLALWRPERVARLVLVGARAGIADPEVRAARVRDDERLARRIEGEGIEAFVDHWMALPVFASQARLGEEALRAARAQRLRNRPEALARSLRGMGVGAQPSLHDALPGVRAPTLLVTGAEDTRFGEAARELASLLPNARHVVLPEAGHAAHLENPRAFAQALRAFASDFPLPSAGEPTMSVDWKRDRKSVV